MKQAKNQTVSEYLSILEHPFKKEIEYLRHLILNANKELTENIKWNAPNFCFNEEDRITMRIHPPKQIQLIFHRGAKVLALPKNNLINDDTDILVWKTTDRAVASFANMKDIKLKENGLIEIINKWIHATSKT